MIADTIPVASSSERRRRPRGRISATTLVVVLLFCCCSRPPLVGGVTITWPPHTHTHARTRRRRVVGIDSGSGGVEYDDPRGDHPCRPRHLHMALGPPSPSATSSSSSSFSSMTISFSTDFRCGPGVGAAGYQVAVLYGKREPSALASEATATASAAEDAGDKDHIAEVNSAFGDGFDHVAFPTGPPEQYNSTHPKYGDYTSDYFHHVTLTKLEYGTPYRYMCLFLHPPHLYDDGAADEESGLLLDEDEHEQLWSASAMDRRRLLQKMRTSSLTLSSSTPYSSASAHFATPPAPQSSSTSSAEPEPQHHRMTLAIVGDLGQTADSATTVGHVMSHHSGQDPIAAVFHAGDLSYANCNQSMWETWFDLIGPLANTVPWHVCPGNHEIEKEPSTGAVFTSYEKRFRMPYETEARITPVEPVVTPNATDDAKCNCTPSVFLGDHYDFGNAYHGTTYGPVRAIFLNSYTSSKPGSRQYDWLSDQLKSVDRAVTPWLLVVMHCPFYNTFRDHAHEAQTVTMKRNLEHLFIKYQVNVIFAGHVHAYTRTKPVAHDVVAVDKRAPTYIVIGDGGNKEGHAREYVDPDHPEAWVARRDRTVFGFGLFDVVNATSARWRWVRNVDALTTAVHDDVFIENQYFL